MKKIMFNDKIGLTKAVLEGRKTQTRRIIKTSDAFERINPDFDWSDEYIKAWNNDFSSRVQRMSKDDKAKCFDYLINHPKFKIGEVVAVAQSYRDCGGLNEAGVPRWDVISQTVGSTNAGWDNKMFVKPELMRHQIRITSVRIQRLQDISDEDCLKEGLEWDGTASQYYINYKKETGRKTFLGETSRKAFAHLIDKVSGKGTWNANPYVWVYDFELVK